MWLPQPALLVTAESEAWGTMDCRRLATQRSAGNQSTHEEPQGELLINLVRIETAQVAVGWESHPNAVAKRYAVRWDGVGSFPCRSWHGRGRGSLYRCYCVYPAERSMPHPPHDPALSAPILHITSTEHTVRAIGFKGTAGSLASPLGLALVVLSTPFASPQVVLLISAALVFMLTFASGSVLRWHTGWRPGWKAYQAHLTEQAKP